MARNPDAEWRAREWLWVTGYRETESPGDSTWGHAERHRETASWWRYAGDKVWVHIPGRPEPTSPEWLPYPDAQPPAPSRKRREGQTYTDENGEGTARQTDASEWKEGEMFWVNGKEE